MWAPHCGPDLTVMQVLPYNFMLWYELHTDNVDMAVVHRALPFLLM